MIRRWWKTKTYRRLYDAVADAFAAGRDAEAEAACERALSLAEDLYGPEDPEVLPLLYARSSAQLAQGRLEQAEASCRRAITLAERAERTESIEPPLSRLLMQLASILERRGDLDGLEALLQRMLAGYERMRDPEPCEHAVVLTRLGLLLGRKGRRDEAAPLLTQAITLRETVFGADHPVVAEALFNAATLRPKGASPEPAEEMLRRALAIAERPSGATIDPLVRASILHNLAVVREEQGAVDDAASLYEQALDVREGLVGAEHVSLRPTLVRLAQLRHAQGQLTAALPLYERALPLAEIEHGAGHPIPEAIKAWIAGARSTN
ncbi:tetratricopeptide repeat protein [Chondromyces crocatus]|uniref:Uncharacterized protein n=1 Tax=Chondromyces crocatus TaxID=52 RepID=A0A0K1E746_CHOCO|nr:tetratricopeptide repeat protein [Chondromyces crocatus]AKT36696.1 uncharacterized protein CMC5_008170 [Chondromyces crocatus]